MYARWRRWLLALVPGLLVFVTWDVLAIRAGHWSFNPDFVTGARIGNLPVEELLFFVAIPTCAILTFEAVRARKPAWFGDGQEPNDEQSEDE